MAVHPSFPHTQRRQGLGKEPGMLTVAIMINGRNPIFARTAVNTDERKGKKVAYRVDDGSTVWHDPKDGAVKLAMKLLKTIKE